MSTKPPAASGDAGLLAAQNAAAAAAQAVRNAAAAARQAQSPAPARPPSTPLSPAPATAPAAVAQPVTATTAAVLTSKCRSPAGHAALARQRPTSLGPASTPNLPWRHLHISTSLDLHPVATVGFPCAFLIRGAGTTRRRSVIAAARRPAADRGLRSWMQRYAGAASSAARLSWSGTLTGRPLCAVWASLSPTAAPAAGPALTATMPMVLSASDQLKPLCDQALSLRPADVGGMINVLHRIQALEVGAFPPPGPGLVCAWLSLASLSRANSHRHPARPVPRVPRARVSRTRPTSRW